MEQINLDIISDEATLQRVKALAGEEKLVTSGIKKVQPVGGQNMPFVGMDPIVVLHVLTAAFQAGAAGVAFLIKLRDLLGPKDKVAVKLPGAQKPLLLTASTSAEEISARFPG